MTSIILLNKPYGVICQFSEDGLHPTLKTLLAIPRVYPAGRLDTDSEGLVLLTENGKLQAKITDPRYQFTKTYWAQIEGVPSEKALDELRKGVHLGKFITQPAQTRRIEEPKGIWPRNPPIRYRKAIPASWIEIKIHEGKNRQIRRMTAHIGHPILRLIRYAVGDWTIEGLAPGEWAYANPESIEYNFKIPPPRPAV